jgi:hypothetical protein
LLLADFVEALKAQDVILVYIFVEGGTEWNISPDAGNPFVDAAFNLNRTRILENL